jgi:uncharacterized UPF0146 family protein
MIITITTPQERVMEIGIGIILYLAAAFGFAAFGRFLKECDESMAEQLNNNSAL